MTFSYLTTLSLSHLTKLINFPICPPNILICSNHNRVQIPICGCYVSSVFFWYGTSLLLYFSWIKNVDQLPCRMFYLVDLFYCLDVTLTHPCDICVFCKIEAKSQGFSGLRLSILTSAPCGGSGMSQCITGGPKRLLFSLLVVLGLSPVLGWWPLWLPFPLWPVSNGFFGTM